MGDHHFNALEYAHQLEEAGVSTAEAEVHANTLARVLENCLSSAVDTGKTKSELLARISEVETTLRAEISGVEAKLRNEISGVEATLRSEIARVEATLRTEIARVEATLRAEIRDLRTDLAGRIDKLETRMNRVSGVIVAAQVALFAMVAGLYLR